MEHWIGLCAPNAGGPGSIPGWGTRSHIHATTKGLHATTKGLHAITKELASCNLEVRLPQLRPYAAK